jgi:type II secretory pathway component PulK
MMDGFGPVVIAVMVVLMVVMCGGMIVGAGWGIRHRWRSRRAAGAGGSEPEHQA